jgi:phosphoribosylaminoimidazolecarboxamide formyltransferase/IMP cyclohydrolase
VIPIEKVTGFKECLDGRVKTLHPNIHAGLLARREIKEHADTLKEMDITPIDMLVINLYPFQKTIMKDGVSKEEAIENIDIGGPAMLRSGAKNHEYVTVLTDPADYEGVLKELEENGKVSYDTNFRLAVKVFEHTAHYDAMIADHFNRLRGDHELKDTFTITFDRSQEMRYGENPHQNAAFYKECRKTSGTIGDAVQLHGKELSYNNINDADGALELLKEFPGQVACVAVKHANPCGVGLGKNVFEAFKKAYDSDPVSIFGGIVAFNRTVDVVTAEKLAEMFLEIIIAPDYKDEAIALLSKKKNIRLLRLSDIEKREDDALVMKKVGGGMLVQTKDTTVVDRSTMKVVTIAQPSDEEIENAIFGMTVCKHVKSNAIVLVKNMASIGIGPGQMSRIGAANIAISMAGEKAKGSVLASDAYFPFEDCVEAAGKAGVTCIIQPGGSISDQKVIDKANELGISIIFTGMRHFKH